MSADNKYQPLRYEITHRYEGVAIDDATFDDLIAAISWQRQPRFIKRGRSSREMLKSPAVMKTRPDEMLRFAKVKGLGVYDPESQGRFRDKILDTFSEEPGPPKTIGLETFVGYPHVGFNKEGGYALVQGRLSPVGGIRHSLALAEYECARRLVENDVPCIVPLAVVRYLDLEFEGDSMGAVISLSPEASPCRLSEVQYLASVQPGLHPESDDYYQRIMDSLGIEGDKYSESVRLQAVNLLARKIGKSVADFSMTGLYRYSSEWSNFEYNFDRQCPVFTDLDSTLSLSDLTPEFRTLQTIRDLGTVTYRLVAKFGTPTALHAYTLEKLLEYDPLFEALSGYLPQAPEKELRRISKILWNAYIPYFFLLKKHAKAINGEWSSERRRSYKMDHDLFYILAITLLFPLFAESPVGRKYPSSVTQQALFDKARDYLGERFEYFQYLMDIFS